MTDTIDALTPEEVEEAKLGLLNRYHYLPDGSGNTTNPTAKSAYDKLAALADAGYVVVTEASLAEALALAEVGCWANPPIHGAEQDAEVHQRDAAAVMSRLRE